MKKLKLGNSALEISEIGFGCMSLKGGEKENTYLLHKAVEAGINFFDTADLYEKGANETTVGNALKSYRQQIILATKVGNKWKEDGSGWDWNPRKEYIIAAVEKSLQRLQTDYIDLYQLHGGTIDDPIEEVIEAFELLQQQGKIKFYGISSIRPNVIRAYVQRSNIVSVMMQYSLLDRRPEEAMLSLLQQHNIGVLARGSVAQGLLINKPPKSYLNYTAAEVEKAAIAIKNLSENKCSATATALQYVLSNAAVTAAVVGIRTENQLIEAVDACLANPLQEAQIVALKESLPVNFYEQHR